MAGNSSTYELRKQINESNIEQWQNWSVNINYVVNQFNDVVNNLTERLEMAEMGNEGLKYKILKGNNNYVISQYSNITIPSSKSEVYTQSCGIFSYKSNTTNETVYIYANKTLQGLYINDKQVSESKTNNIYYPFTSIPGSITGSRITIKTDNAQKISDDIKIIFSQDASLAAENFPAITSDTMPVVSLKIGYSQIVTKQLFTINKSALSKALLDRVPIRNEQTNISKYSAPLGQYSTTNTVAKQAKIKNTRINNNLLNNIRL